MQSVYSRVQAHWATYSKIIASPEKEKFSDITPK